MSHLLITRLFYWQVRLCCGNLAQSEFNTTAWNRRVCDWPLDIHFRTSRSCYFRHHKKHRLRHCTTLKKSTVCTSTSQSHEHCAVENGPCPRSSMIIQSIRLRVPGRPYLCRIGQSVYLVSTMTQQNVLSLLCKLRNWSCILTRQLTVWCWLLSSSRWYSWHDEWQLPHRWCVHIWHSTRKIRAWNRQSGSQQPSGDCDRSEITKQHFNNCRQHPLR